eukprot:scaffold39385_cov46-Attheya_sp.AAC.3
MRGFRVAVGSVVGVAASCWLGVGLLCLPVVEGQRPTPGDLVTRAPMVTPLDPVTDAPVVGVVVTPAPLAAGTTGAPTIAIITTGDPTLAPTIRAPSSNDPNGSTTGVYSQTTPKWDGCNDPNFPGGPHVVKRGDPTTVCLTLGPNGDWGRETPLVKYFRLNFQPEADEYSRYQIPNSYKELVVESILSSSDNSVAPKNIT